MKTFEDEVTALVHAVADGNKDPVLATQEIMDAHIDATLDAQQDRTPLPRWDGE